MARRYNSFRTPRPKKFKNPVRVKERIAKKGGKCAACRGRYEPGDAVTVVNIRRRTYHRQGCVPVNVNQMPVAGGVGPAVGVKPSDVVAAMKSNWTVGEAKMVAIQAMENAMVVIAKNSPTITPEMDKSFERFAKCKGMFMRPGSTNEERQAARLSMLEIVKTFF